MAIESKTRRMSADEFLAFRGEPGKRYELVDGAVTEMSPPGGLHGEISLEVGALVRNFVRPRGLGAVYAAETGFLLHRNPDRVRAPDAAFVARGRLPEGRSPEGWIPVAPDFAVEVVSPNDTAAEVQDRVDDWLSAGTSVVWVLYPSQRSAFVFRGLDRVERHTGEEELDVEPILPGFRCKTNELFPS